MSINNNEPSHIIGLEADGKSWGKTYDRQGKLIIKICYNPDGSFCHEETYDGQGRVNYYSDSNGKKWKRTYNEDGSYRQINL